MIPERYAPMTYALFRIVFGLMFFLFGLQKTVGILGAGVILRDEAKRRVEGLTTASSIWVGASLGVACGAGYWRLALLALGIALAVLIGGGPLERACERILTGAARPERPTEPNSP